MYPPCDELYPSVYCRLCAYAVFTSCAEIPLLCINSYGRFLGLLSVTVHLQSSTLNAGPFFSPSPSPPLSAGASSAGGSSPSSPSPTTFFYVNDGCSGFSNTSYSISFSSMYSFSA